MSDKEDLIWMSFIRFSSLLSFLDFCSKQKKPRDTAEMSLKEWYNIAKNAIVASYKIDENDPGSKFLYSILGAKHKEALDEQLKALDDVLAQLSAVVEEKFPRKKVQTISYRDLLDGEILEENDEQGFPDHEGYNDIGWEKIHTSLIGGKVDRGIYRRPVITEKME